jgi:hypothetical protein
MMAGYGLWLERFAANGVVVDLTLQMERCQ